MKQLHKIQIEILQKLLFANSLRYTEMKPDKEMENNQFDFHLDQLIDQGLVKKENGKYALTNTGKEFANRVDESEQKLKLQAKVSVLVGIRKNTLKGFDYLIYTRLKHPFYGCQGFMSGKVKYGEKITDAAERELKEETNLEGKATIIGAKHFRVFNKETNELLEDKIMYFCRVENPTGEMKFTKEGSFEWIPEEKVFETITKPFETLKNDFVIMTSTKKQAVLIEEDHVTESF